jgi:Mitochondrial carrier protein
MPQQLLKRSTTTNKRYQFTILYFVLFAIPVVFPFYYHSTTSVAFVMHPVMAIQQRHAASTAASPNKLQHRNSLNQPLKNDDTAETESTLIAVPISESGINTSLSSENNNALLTTSWMALDNWNRSVVVIIIIPLIVLLTAVLLPMMSHVDTAYASTIPLTTATAATALPIDWNAIFQKALKKAVGGGQAGALAAVVQVCTLMWLRTCMNYQYRYGGNLITSFQTLYQEGGIGRLYQGLPFAIVQGPLTRFGDTAANVGILSLLESIPLTQSLPLPIKTLCGSVAAGLWRIVLMPIDTSKTSLQVEGSKGLQKLYAATMEAGPGVLYRGSLAQAAATAVGHFPWFLTYNFFNDIIPMVDATTVQIQDPNTLMLLSLGRSALLGLLASCVSDCSSNSLRVIKTTKQTAQLNDSMTVDTASTTPGTTKSKSKEMSYLEVVQLIIEQDGIVGLFGRGLQTRLLTNAIQGAMFSVLWKYFQQP